MVVPPVETYIIPINGEVPKEALANHLLEIDFPKGWKALRLETYNGMGDLGYHIHTFTMGMEDMMPQKDIWCHMFCQTLIEDVIECYQTLSLGGIHSYEELEKAFRNAFSHMVY